jgi:molecular chaperone GrpE
MILPLPEPDTLGRQDLPVGSTAPVDHTMRACAIARRAARTALPLRVPALQLPVLRAIAAAPMAGARPFSVSSAVFESEKPAAGEEAKPEEVSSAAAELAAKDERIAELEKQVAEFKDARLRALAELENVRRIAARDVDNAKEFSIQKFAKQLLDVQDNLHRAVEAIPEGSGEAEEDALAVGVRATARELEKVLALNGITPFCEVGDKYDANTMEAMFAVPVTDDLPPGTVGQVLTVGYKFKSRVLRPARVGATPQC